MDETHQGPHVFGGVNADAGHSYSDEAVQISRHFIADVVQGSVQVRQSDQVAIADVVGISVVVDVAVE